MTDSDFAGDFARFFNANVLPWPADDTTRHALKHFDFGPVRVKDRPSYCWVCLPKGWQKRVRGAGWAVIQDPNSHDRFEFCYRLVAGGDRLAYTRALTRFAVCNDSLGNRLVDAFGYYVLDRVTGVVLHHNHSAHQRGLTEEECVAWLDDPANGCIDWRNPLANWPEVSVPKWWQFWRS